MKALIIYDSSFGNTEKAARAIAEAAGGEAKHVKDVSAEDVMSADLLIAGSPTQGGRGTQGIQDWLKGFSAGDFKGKKVAAFDTRMDEESQKFWLKSLMKAIGYAAPKISKGLREKGGEVAADPAGFIVEGREGPLREGEAERAAEWGRRIAGNM